MAGKNSGNDIRCSFCNKTQSQVRKLIAGPAGVYICDECVDICADILEEELEDEEDFDLLEERLLNYPALAIAQCHRVMNGMSKKVRKNVNRAMNLLNDYEQDKFNKVQRKEIRDHFPDIGKMISFIVQQQKNTCTTAVMQAHIT